jgi:hypothetical protein
MAAENITIDGTDYAIADLNDGQKYMINQIEAISRKEAAQRFELDQTMMARRAFENALVAAISSQEGRDGENDNGSPQKD